MPKRHRDEAKAAAHVESSLESGRRFDAYIRGWVQQAIEPPVVRPSSLPSLTPLPSLLRVTASPNVSEPSSATNNSTTKICSSIPPLPPASVPLTTGGTAVVYDLAMLEHASADATEYERPARLSTTVDHLAAVGLLGCCQRLPARSAKTKELRRVHSRELVDLVDQLDFFMGIRDEKGGSTIGQDLYASASTSKAARLAAGCVIEAAHAVVSGAVTNAFALIRPPGHHAGSGNAAGFCLFNNVAVAARAAQEELLAQRPVATPASEAKPRILILDWDVHHCDGTENIFYDDPSVLVVSIHQYGHGRGHVLRKPPSAQPTGAAAATAAPAASNAETSTAVEDISVDDLAALLLPSSPDPAEATGKAQPLEAVSALPVEAEEPMPALEAMGGRRVRKPVDYKQLAAQLDEEGDADIAAFFGVDVNAPASSSSSSSSSSATPGDTSSAPGGGAAAKAVHCAGDTVGLSHDESVPVSADEDLFYPGTGHLRRVGGEMDGAAKGRNINIPWPTHDFGDLEYLQVVQELVLPAAQEFKPDLVLISSGFDSARGDLLGSMALSPSGFYVMTRMMAQHFPKLVVALEGGYNVKNVALGSEAVLRALLESGGCRAERLPKSRMLWSQTAALVAEVKKAQAPYWGCFS